MIYAFTYLLIGFLLILQHSLRYYFKNKKVLEFNGYKNSFIDSKLFYFTAMALWPFALDYLIEVSDYND